MKIPARVLNVFIFLVFISGAIFLNGCDNKAVDPITGLTINGKVGDESGTGIGGLLVSIQGTTATSASDGSFSISGVNIPYDVKILQTGGTIPTGIVYHDLATVSPVLFAIGINSSPNTSSLTVNIPALNVNQVAKVYFTDGANVESIGTISFPSTSAGINVKWPGSASITGKVIVLVYTLIGTEILSYNNYGEKTGVVLTNGSPSSATFTASDIAIDPGETTVSGSITAPSGYSSISSSLELTFRLQGSNMNAEELTTTSASSFNYLMPTGLTSTFRTLIGGKANGTVSGSVTSKSSQVAAGSSGNNLVLEEVPTLTAPAATTNIDTTTAFSFTTGAGPGVNLIYFSSASAQFYVFTNFAGCNIPNFSANGVGIGSSVNYEWAVEKISEVANTNNMVSTPLLQNTTLAGFSISGFRTFTTAP